jgi:hypothetical protein
MAKPGNKAYPCRYCRASMQFALSYNCPKCGRHNDDMYRAEHVNPAKAKGITIAQLREEYATAGLEYRDG